MMKKGTMVKTALMAILLVMAGKVFSGIEQFHQRIYSTAATPVVIGQSSATVTTNVSPKTGAFLDPVVQNLFTFGIDHLSPVYVDSAMDVKIKLSVQRFDEDSVSLGSFSTYLEINYHPNDSLAYVDRDFYQFFNAYTVKITIDSIYINGVSDTVLPANLYIDNDINIDRYYDFSSNASDTIAVYEIDPNDPNDVINLDCDTIADEIEVKWPTVTGAEEYQLEWTFVNDYGTTGGSYLAASVLDYDFKNNSTRITTTNTWYRITLAFDHGYVIYRVRALGRDTADLDHVIAGVWSLPNSGDVDDANTRYLVTDPHEGNKNWQFSTTFAEEGKKKEVVSYFDGSLRNRQTVTRINTDNNVVVGETIYDHQGRPAVTVLPVPVVACETDSVTAIKFYPNFNVDTSGVGYSRDDFDLDASGDSCAMTVRPMDTTSGASNYYSPNNPDKSGFNAYIPDAKMYPFTQVEYTPDNTGRIRRQSGVGDNYQLNTGHETKYFYGQPNQLQLDRLFGSEVGDAAHYKKNLVIDPNGQISVSYLDQEGRVIATALAGAVPQSDTNDRLQPLASEANALDTLTIDLFAKNADDSSSLNTVNQSGDALIFGTQLLVAEESVYEFDYTINVDTLDDPCIKNNICFNCVYDLTIKVTDDCGINLALIGGDSIVKTIGKFDIINDTIQFITDCDSPTDLDDTSAFNITLSPGNYTVTKTLTVNADARNFYVQAYLDTTYNSCVKTLEDFQDEYLAAVDTSGCYISCEDCFTALGDRDEFVANGEGTAAEYDVLYENCERMCGEEKSVCETTYEMLLLDMSPGGQYAEYLTNNGTIDPTGIALSVLNENNSLPARMGGSVNSHWRTPQAVINGTTYNNYLEEDGTVSWVTVYPDGANYIPEVVDTADVEYNSTTGAYYTLPENIANVRDFIEAFKPSWARSLVTYHPEYCYYEICSGYAVKENESDDFSSESFDKLLLRTLTFDDAVANDFIKPDYDTILNVNSRVYSWFDTSSVHAWDPFVVYSSSFDDYGVPLENKFNLFQTDYNGTGYTMVELAAITARCGGYVPNLPDNYCYQFGKDLIPGGSASFNDSIRNLEWTFLKNFYFSYKQQLQQQRVDSIVVFSGCDAYNGCIGNDEYNAAGTIMYTLTGTLYFHRPYYDAGQPCGYFTHHLYIDKQPRFVSPAHLNVNDNLYSQATESGYQQYLLTGQCPMAVSMESFFSTIASHSGLNDTLTAINFYPATSAVFITLNNNIPQILPVLDWEMNSVTDTTLTAKIMNTDVDTSICTTTLDISGTGIDWEDISGFTNLQSSDVTAPTYSFTALAIVNTNDTLTYYEISGTTCVNMATCRFNLECKNYEFTNDLSELMSALAFNGELLDTPVDLEDTNYADLLTLPIRNTLGAPNSELRWSYDETTHGFSIYDSTNTNKRIYIGLNRVEPPSFNLNDLDQINYFAGIHSEFENAFVVNAYDTSGTLLVTIHADVIKYNGTDSSMVTTGDCGLPDPMNCQLAGHKVRKDLERLLNERLTQKPFAEDIDLYESPYLTALLQTYFDDSTASTSSEYVDTTISGTHYDTLTFSITTCELVLYHSDDTTPELILDSLVSFTGLTATGQRNAEGDYNDFYAIGTYSINDTLYTDTIFGTSCLPLQNCIACHSEEDTIQERTAVLVMDIYGSSSAYDYFYDNTIEQYTQYTAAIDSLNNRMGWMITDSAYVQKISVTKFFKKGMAYAMPSYISYVNYFDPGVDSAELVQDIYRYIAHFGHGTNVNLQYKRYEKAEQRFNAYAAVQSYIPHPIVTQPEFRQREMAREMKDYVAYLKEQQDLLQDAMNYDDWYPAYHTMQDSCDTLYNLYVEAWEYFDSTQQINNTCLNYLVFYPLYDQTDFESNNLCCSDTGFALFNEYIESFYDTTACPLPLPYLDSCEVGTVDTTACQSLYTLYENTIDDFNNSVWADSNNVQLPFDYGSLLAFIEDGKCYCAQSYITYLETWINADWNDSLPIPVDLDHWEDCTGSPYDPENPCVESYDTYLDCYSMYLEFVAANPGLGLPTQSTVAKLQTFKAKSLCNCVDAYCTGINTIIDGFVTDSLTVVGMINLETYCNELTELPCTPDPVLLDTFANPVSEYTNPCVDYLLNVALENAENAYHQYRDSLATIIAQQYNEHCLSALENFTATYEDKEYHFTLYYYDQSGNLIKTIPPEGIQKLDIDSYTDATAQDIIADRTYGTHTVFTGHRMATQYEYNSLNQLVKQNLPDHNQMTIWETTLPNGLDTRFEATEVNFVNENKGFMSGYLTNGSSTYGMVYSTNDGGTTWQRVNNLAGTHIKKVFWVNDTLAYGAGSNGIMIKTIDAGNNWTVMNGYRSDLGLYNFNDVYFSSTTTGIFVGDRGICLRTTDGGSTFSLISYTGKNSSDTIVALAGTGTTVLMAVVKNNISGIGAYTEIHTSSGTGSAWSQVNAYRGNGNRAVQYMSYGRVMSVGDDGNAYERRLFSGTFRWETKTTGTHRNMKDVYFMNPSEGITIQDSADTYGQIYKTSDGGNTWELLSEPGDYYTKLYPYVKSGTVHKVVAVGRSGLVHRILLKSGQPFGIIKLNSPSTANYKAVWAAEQADGSTWILAANANSTNTIYFTDNGEDAVATWTMKASVTNGVSDMMFKNYVSGSTITLSGTVLDGNTDAFPAFYNSSGTLTIGTFSPAIPSNAAFSGNEVDLTNNRIYLLDSINQRIRLVSINGSSISTTSTQLSNLITITVPNALSYNQNDTLFIVNPGGGNMYGVINNTVNPPTIAWTAASDNYRHSAVRDITRDPASGLYYSCGDDGLIFERLSSGVIKTVLSGTSEKLNAIKFCDTTTAFIAANNGKAYKVFVTPGANTLMDLSETSTGTTEKLNDISIRNKRIYMAGENGTLLYSPDTATVSFSALPATNATLSGVSFRPNTNTCFATGENSAMFMASGYMAIEQENIFLPTMRSVHFSDPSHGYALADNYNIRHTTDGGLSWAAVKPSANIGANYVTFNRIISLTDNTGAFVGVNRRYNDISNNVATQLSVATFGGTSDNNLKDITSKNGNIYVVISNTPSNVGYIYYKPSGSTFSLKRSITNGPLNAVHMFNNNNCIVAGDNGKIAYYILSSNDTNYFNPPSSVNTNKWNDIYFHDDLNGYVTGENGVILRATDFSLDGSGNTVFGSWSRMKTDDSLVSQYDSTKMNIKAIGAGDHNYPITAGTYDNTGAASTQKGYARKIHDESEKWSTYFWYDRLGRIVLSQNSKQFNKEPQAYSYTLYDALGRVTEAGEKAENSDSTMLFEEIFGETINNFYNPNVINDDSLLAWISDSTGTRREVTRTVYDTTAIAGLPLTQDHLRKRISSVFYQETYNPNITEYDHATHYTYDIHGNVKTLIQDNRKLATNAEGGTNLSEQQYKRMDYEYDLISCNLNKTSYQADSIDSWYHRYEYDADNRITQVETSTNKIQWDVDGKYFYYAHRPLARIEIGDLQVQGIDYIYTLQGWIKGVNSVTLDSTRDVGKDGFRDSSNTNFNFPKDVFGYSLGFFQGDYFSIDTSFHGSNSFDADLTGSDILSNRFDLFNGNISSSVISITNPNTREVLPLGNAYKYDQLNRLLESKSFVNINFNTNSWNFSGTYDNRYYNQFSYDENGNILAQWRFDEAGDEIDSLHYMFARNANDNLIQNRLYHLRDQTNYNALDLDDMGVFDDNLDSINSNNNYGYTEIGELTHNNQEEIAEIVWRNDGKIKAVKRTPSSIKNNIKFDYNGSGHRIAKHLYESDDSTWLSSEFYVVDANGQIVSVYEYKFTDTLETMSYHQTERHIYGNQMMGIDNDSLEMIGAFLDTTNFSRTLGRKTYFGNNHLGNVISQVSDKKIAIDIDNDDTVDFFQAEIISSTDYSPFGVELENRKFSNENSKYGFNGKRKDNELFGEGNAYNFGQRINGTREGRWMSPDPFEFKYPFISTYSVAANNPVYYIDKDGNDIWTFYENGDFKYEASPHVDAAGMCGDYVYYVYEDGTKENLGAFKWYHFLPFTGTPLQEIKEEFFSRPEAYAMLQKTNSEAHALLGFINILEWVEFGSDMIQLAFGIGEIKAAIKAGGKLTYTFIKSTGKLIIGEGASISTSEAKVAELLVKEGKTVEKLAENGKDKTADFFVDGVKTEVGSLTKDFTVDSKVVNRAANRLKNKINHGQAKDYIFDFGETVITEDQAKEILKETTRKIKSGGNSMPNSIRIIGKGYDIKQ